MSTNAERQREWRLRRKEELAKVREVRTWEWYEGVLVECQLLHEEEMRGWLNANWRRTVKAAEVSEQPVEAQPVVPAGRMMGEPSPKPVARVKKRGYR